MKLAVKNKNIAVILLMIIFFVGDLRLFYLVGLPNVLSGNASNKALLALFSIAAVIFWVAYNRGKIRFGGFGAMIFILFCIFTISSVVSMVKFNYRITQVIYSAFPIICLLFYFPLVDILSKKENQETFIKIGMILWDILALLFLLQYFVYKINGTVFLKIGTMIPTYYLNHHEEGMRIYSVFDGFLRIFILVVAHRCIKKNFSKCIFEMLSVVIMLASVVLIDKSRTYLVFLLIAILCDFFIYNRKKMKNRSIIVGIGVMAVVAVILIYKVGSILGSIAGNTGSRYARVEGIAYYKEVIKENFLFGIGAESPLKGEPNFYLVHGDKGIYNTSDVGIIGTVVKFGVFGVIWFMWFVIKCIRMAIATKGENRSLSLGIMIMVLMCIPITSFLDPERLITMLMTMLILETNLLNSKREKTGDIVE